ncbi:MAG TPA: metallophosphoesterase family protein [Bacilli bacterium]|nr:MAG: Calcineurin-like phosphoesterase [Tenericutes bacterium ADurb.BinA124]HNZ50206.1 metallophosphoesterase family protein [Bacilli bacterium]HPX83917.1 metallophosphoesterase family protein [Bacilli bacterium]
MKKLGNLLLFLLISVVLIHLPVQAAPLEAYYIVTNPGENMSTEMNINWHSDVEGSFLELTYGTDANFSQAQRFMGECRAFSYDASFSEGGKSFTTTGFSQRNVCQVSLRNLTPNTEYRYRVGKTSFSDSYKFKTASGLAPFSFLYLTDPQYYSDATAAIFNNFITQALTLDPDIRFSLFSGDVVDRGGKMEQWTMLFKQSNLRNMPIATTPGNHEYYDASSSPATYTNGFYNGFFNNPKNGAEVVKNTNYFFRYNNVLFISIDSEAAAKSSTAMEKQKTWFSEVIEANHAQYIIVFMHRSFYGSVYGSYSPVLRANWQGLFDKYGVDVVLTGHDHVYCRTAPIYQGVKSTDPHQGTVYIIGGAAGSKLTYSLVPNPLFEAGFDKESSVTIFKVDSTGLHIKTINADNLIKDQVTIPAKRSATVTTNLDKQAYLQTITLKLDASDNTKATFNWGTKGYGHVNSVKLMDAKNQVIGYDYLNTNYLTSLPLSNLLPNSLYEYTLTVAFKDGTVLTKPLSLSTKLPYGKISNFDIDDEDLERTTLNWTAKLENDQIEKYEIWLNGSLLQTLDKDATSGLLTGINKYHVNEISFKAIDIFGDVVFTEVLTYGEEAEAVSLLYAYDELRMKPNESQIPELTVLPLQVLDLRFHSSNDAVATVDSFGQVRAIGVGEAIITASVYGRSDVWASFTVKVEEEIIEPDPDPNTDPDPDPNTDPDPDPNTDPDPDPDTNPEPEPETSEPEVAKKGCFNSLNKIFISLAVVAFIIIRRKEQ